MVSSNFSNSKVMFFFFLLFSNDLFTSFPLLNFTLNITGPGISNYGLVAFKFQVFDWYWLLLLIIYTKVFWFKMKEVVYLIHYGQKNYVYVFLIHTTVNGKWNMSWPLQKDRSAEMRTSVLGSRRFLWKLKLSKNLV